MDWIDDTALTFEGYYCTSNRHTHSFLKTKVSSHEGERHGDAEPQSQDGHQRAEGHGGRRTLAPQNQIHKEKIGEHHAAGETECDADLIADNVYPWLIQQEM